MSSPSTEKIVNHKNGGVSLESSTSVKSTNNVFLGSLPQNLDTFIVGKTYRVGSDHEICIVRKTKDKVPFHSFSLQIEGGKPVESIVIRLQLLDFNTKFTYRNINTNLLSVRSELNRPFDLHFLKINFPVQVKSRAEIKKLRREKKAAKKIRNVKGYLRRLPEGELEAMDIGQAIDECANLFYLNEFQHNLENLNESVRQEVMKKRRAKRQAKKIRNVKGLLRRLPEGETEAVPTSTAMDECTELMFANCYEQAKKEISEFNYDF